MKVPIGNLQGLTSKTTGIVGPWPCEECGQMSQFADITKMVNRVFCKNEKCGFTRIIDKHHHRIIEWDGSCWEFDNTGKKWRVRLP